MRSKASDSGLSICICITYLLTGAKVQIHMFTYILYSGKPPLFFRSFARIYRAKLSPYSRRPTRENPSRGAQQAGEEEREEGVRGERETERVRLKYVETPIHIQRTKILHGSCVLRRRSSSGSRLVGRELLQGRCGRKRRRGGDAW
jgi:hypothetical protein